MSATITVQMAFGFTASDETPTWTTVTSYVRSCDWKRGRQNELNQTQAGTGSLLLGDPDSAFDARNTASPFYPDVKPGMPVRAYLTTDDAATHPLFTMYVERLPRTLRVTDTYTERQLSLIDGFALLSTAGISGDDYIEQLSSDRVAAVLDNITWPAARRSIGTGASTIVAYSVPNHTDSYKALAHLLQVNDSENGFLFCDAAGNVVFIGRHELITDTAYTVPSATFRDAGGSSGDPCVDLVPSHDLDNIINKAVGQRDGGTAQTWKDHPSIADYFLHEQQFTSLVTTDAEVLNQMQWKVGQFGQPLNRVDSITIMPCAYPTDTTTIGHGVDREIGDRITVLETPPGFGGEVSDDYQIQSLAGKAEIGPIQSLTLTFMLWPASTTAFWIAGDASQSLAGVSTRPGY